MAVARECADNVHDAAFFDLKRELNGVSLDCETDGCESSNLSLNGVRQAIERQRNIVYAPGKLLQRVEVAAGDLFSPIDDEDVIAKLFRFAEDLRREDDGSSFLDFGPQKIHYLTLQDGIHKRQVMNLLRAEDSLPDASGWDPSRSRIHPGKALVC